MSDYEKVISTLKKKGSLSNIEGMKRYGIETENAFGVPMPVLVSLAKAYRNNHSLALELWKSGYHEARILAGKMDNPAMVNEKQMDSWVKDFNSWDVCDQVCGNLFVFTPFAEAKAIEWSQSKKEFVKRAGFTSMACLAQKKIKLKDRSYTPFLAQIELHASDERNMVKKAVNWALRQIGKRNLFLNKKAILVAKKLSDSENKTSRWVGRDALRELSGESVQQRLVK